MQRLAKLNARQLTRLGWVAEAAWWRAKRPDVVQSSRNTESCADIRSLESTRAVPAGRPRRPLVVVDKSPRRPYQPYRHHRLTSTEPPIDRSTASQWVELEKLRLHKCRVEFRVEFRVTRYFYSMKISWNKLYHICIQLNAHFHIICIIDPAPVHLLDVCQCDECRWVTPILHKLIHSKIDYHIKVPSAIGKRMSDRSFPPIDLGPVFPQEINLPLI